MNLTNTHTEVSIHFVELHVLRHGCPVPHRLAYSGDHRQLLEVAAEVKHPPALTETLPPSSALLEGSRV